MFGLNVDSLVDLLTPEQVAMVPKVCFDAGHWLERNAVLLEHPDAITGSHDLDMLSIAVEELAIGLKLIGDMQKALQLHPGNLEQRRDSLREGRQIMKQIDRVRSKCQQQYGIILRG